MPYRVPTLDNLNSMQKLLIGIDFDLYVTTGRTGVYTSLSGIYVKHDELATSGGATIEWSNIVNVPVLSGVGVNKVYVDSQDAALSGYCETAFVNISGDTMTGFLVLNADPTDPYHAATKQYVDNQTSSGYLAADALLSGVLFSGYKAADLALSGALQGDFVNISGDTMTGFLTLHANPVLSGHAATKAYVDARDAILLLGYQSADTLLSGTVVSGYQAADVVNFNIITSGYQAADLAVSGVISSGYKAADVALSGALQNDFVNVSGDTMSGFLTLYADPTQSGHAATKQYVDSKLVLANINIQEDGLSEAASVNTLNFVHALNVTSGSAVQIDVDESAFSTVVKLTGNQVIAGTKTFNNDVIVKGTLNVSGSINQVTLEELLIEDTKVILNSTWSGNPTLDAAIVVERGSETDAQLYWDENLDKWLFGISGVGTMQEIASVSGYQAADTALSGALVSGYQAGDVAVTSGYQAADTALSGALQNDFVNVSGDTMTGFLTLNANPTQSGHAATKAYVDGQLFVASGNFVHLTEDEVISGAKTFAGDVHFLSELTIKSHSNFTGSHLTFHTDGVQTTNDDPTGFTPIPIDSNSAYWFETNTIGKRDGSPLKVRMESNKACVYRDGSGSAVFVGVVEDTFSRSLNAPDYNVTLTLSGNNLVVTVDGATGETVNWSTTVAYQKISLNV